MNYRVLSLLGLCLTAVSEIMAGQPTLRRPCAIAYSDKTAHLYVANQASNTISTLDIQQQAIIREWPVAGSPSDLVVSQDLLLVTDQSQHRLLVLDSTSGQELSASDLPEYPMRLVWSETHQQAYTTSLWSRQLTQLAVTRTDDTWSVNKLKSLDLPFEPLELCLSPDEQWLIVAGAFQAELALVELQSFVVHDTHLLNGHNLRGLCTIDDRLLATMQQLNPLAHSTRDDIHWGNMISNLLVEIPLSDLRQSQIDVNRLRRDSLLGDPGNAAGDPGVLLASSESLSILLSGTGQLALADRNGTIRQRITTGQRPVDIAACQDQLAIANYDSDSITLVNPLSPAALAIEISLGARRELRPEEKGEQLFFDSRLSHDGWMSCHSCHTDGHTNHQLNDNLSDGSLGTPKRVLSLLGVAHTGPWSWLGQVDSLEEQVRNSIEFTMRGKLLSDEQVDNLVAFLRTLEIPSPVHTLQSTHPLSAISPALESQPADQSARRGAEVFRDQGCAACHQPEIGFTSPRTYEVGLTDEAGNLRFNPPSLLGVSRSNRFFHDARATSLREALSMHQEQLSQPLTTAQISALEAYLSSLSSPTLANISDQ